MKASEARKLFDDSTIPQMSPIYKGIRSAAGLGHTKISIAVGALTNPQIGAIIAVLRADGYSVKRDTYSDYRDEWDNLNISWEREIPTADGYYNK